MTENALTAQSGRYARRHATSWELDEHAREKAPGLALIHSPGAGQRPKVC